MGVDVVVGTPRKFVLEVLGPPNDVEEDALFYIIGNRSGLGMDHVILHVQFNESDEVVRWYMLQH